MTILDFYHKAVQIAIAHGFKEKDVNVSVNTFILSGELRIMYYAKVWTGEKLIEERGPCFNVDAALQSLNDNIESHLLTYPAHQQDITISGGQ